jgi:DUF971 family protein
MNQDISPLELKQVSPSKLSIVWNDAHVSEYHVRNLRLECRCAVCVDEWTREKLLKDETVPAEVVPKRIQTVGRYALNFAWSDGHDTGFYTFEHLRNLCECALCHKH